MLRAVETEGLLSVRSGIPAPRVRAAASSEATKGGPARKARRCGEVEQAGAADVTEKKCRVRENNVFLAVFALRVKEAPRGTVAA